MEIAVSGIVRPAPPPFTGGRRETQWRCDRHRRPPQVTAKAQVRALWHLCGVTVAPRCPDCSQAAGRAAVAAPRSSHSRAGVQTLGGRGLAGVWRQCDGAAITPLRGCRVDTRGCLCHRTASVQPHSVWMFRGYGAVVIRTASALSPYSRRTRAAVSPQIRQRPHNSRKGASVRRLYGWRLSVVMLGTYCGLCVDVAPPLKGSSVTAYPPLCSRSEAVQRLMCGDTVAWRHCGAMAEKENPHSA